MDVFEMTGKDTIDLLTRNAVKCLVCNTVLESKHRHDFRGCCCENQTFVDGGMSYNRYGSRDLDKVQNLCEYKTYTKDEYYTLKKEREEAKQKALQERINNEEVVNIGGAYYDVKTINMLVELGKVDKDYLKNIMEFDK